MGTITVDKAKFGIPHSSKQPDGQERPKAAPIRIDSSDSDNGDSLKKIPVSLLEIDDCNIRTSDNPKFADIKKSIASDRGSSTVFHVTKNTDDEGYTVVFGTGTRLSVLKELSSEYSGEAENPFKFAHCIVVPNQTIEKRTLASINENYARGDNSYIEWAQAIMSLKNIVESENQGKLSDADFCKYVGENGLSISKTELVRCRFASGQLAQSVPVAMTRGRKSTVFVRKIMEGRSAAIVIAMAELEKSRESLYPSYDNALMKTGSKMDGANVDQTELLKRTEKLFFKANGVSQNAVPAPAPVKNKHKSPDGDQTITAQSQVIDSGGLNIEPVENKSLSSVDVINYLVSLDKESFDSLLKQAVSKRS